MPWNDVLHPGGTNTPDWEPLVSINAFKSMKCTPVPRYLTVALTATRGDWEQPWRISVGPSPLVGPIQATLTPSCSASSFVRAPFCFVFTCRCATNTCSPQFLHKSPPTPGTSRVAALIIVSWAILRRVMSRTARLARKASVVANASSFTLCFDVKLKRFVWRQASNLHTYAWCSLLSAGYVASRQFLFFFFDLRVMSQYTPFLILRSGVSDSSAAFRENASCPPFCCELLSLTSYFLGFNVVI